MRKYNPKQFYKVFNKRKSKVSYSDISMQQFMEHFRNLNEVHNQSEDAERDIDDDLHAAYDAVADPEANLGGGGSRGPKGRVGEGTGGVSPPVGGGSGGLPRENLEKMKQNGAIWECKSSLLNSLKLKLYF